MFHSIKSSIHVVRITVIVKLHHHLRISAVCYGCYSCTRSTHIKFASCCLDESLNSLPVSVTYTSRWVNDKSNIYNGLAFFICEVAKNNFQTSWIYTIYPGDCGPCLPLSLSFSFHWQQFLFNTEIQINLKKRGKTTTLADISSLLKEFVSCPDEVFLSEDEIIKTRFFEVIMLFWNYHPDFGCWLKYKLKYTIKRSSHKLPWKIP